MWSFTERARAYLTDCLNEVSEGCFEFFGYHMRDLWGIAVIQAQLLCPGGDGCAHMGHLRLGRELVIHIVIVTELTFTSMLKGKMIRGV
jgi:hypothetical protein